MKKYLLFILIAAVAAVFLPGCDEAVSPLQTGMPPSDDPVSEAVDTEDAVDAGIWETVHGNYTRESNQNDVLALKYLSNSCVLFEFRLTESSESGDTHDTIIYGVMIIFEDGVGIYETLTDAESPFTVSFKISDDGQRVTVSHTGDLSISPDGEYTFADSSLEVSDLSANAIIEHLPTAATSLNSNLGAYTIRYPDALVADWFYPVEAVFDDSGAVLAKFVVAKDLSAVFRADDDIEPVLIFGSAQPMMDAATDGLRQSGGEDSADDESAGTPLVEPAPVVSAALDGGVVMSVGASSRLTASLPWELSYSITAQSSDGAVVAVDADGVVTALAPGEATISGTITVEDGVKDFSIDVTVSDELAEEAEA